MKVVKERKHVTLNVIDKFDLANILRWREQSHARSLPHTEAQRATLLPRRRIHTIVHPVFPPGVPDNRRYNAVVGFVERNY